MPRGERRRLIAGSIAAALALLLGAWITANASFYLNHTRDSEPWGIYVDDSIKVFWSEVLPSNGGWGIGLPEIGLLVCVTPSYTLNGFHFPVYEVRVSLWWPLALFAVLAFLFAWRPVRRLMRGRDDLRLPVLATSVTVALIAFWLAAQGVRLLTSANTTAASEPFLPLLGGFRFPLALSLAWTVWLWNRWRPTARRRSVLCDNCGYDLTGNVSRRCPECGTPSGSVGPILACPPESDDGDRV